MALTNKTIPATTAALKDPEVQKLNTIAGFGVALNVGVPMANTPYADAQWGPVGDASAAVWTGKQAPAEAMAAAQTPSKPKSRKCSNYARREVGRADPLSTSRNLLLQRSPICALGALRGDRT